MTISLVSCIGEGESPFSLASDSKSQKMGREREKHPVSEVGSLGQVHKAFSGSAVGNQRIKVEIRIFPKSQTQNSK